MVSGQSLPAVHRAEQSSAGLPWWTVPWTINHQRQLGAQSFDGEICGRGVLESGGGARQRERPQDEGAACPRGHFGKEDSLDGGVMESPELLLKSGGVA